MPVTEIISVSNQEITFMIPNAEGCSGDYELTINGETASIPFLFTNANAPTISALSLTSSSPILKRDLVITGSNLGTLSSTKIFLYKKDGTRAYELNAVTVSPTEITCILGGGRVGAYDVVIVVDGVGASLPNANSEFSYEIVVTGVSVDSNSMGGGYNMIVTGSNFAPEKNSNNVFIGDALNSICEVISSTETEIVCEVPQMHEDYSAGDSLEVVVTARITEESVCEGTCSFAYSESQTAFVNVPESL